MSDPTLFYCWQSDLPNKTCRNFIRKCIEAAAKKVSTDVRCDEDARGTVGMGDIPQELLRKIRECQVFVCDLTIVNRESGSTDQAPAGATRRMPNPNVMFELGFAVATHHWDRVIGVFNSEYGSYEDLPFDLGWRTPISYRLAESAAAEEVARERDSLVPRLAKAIGAVLALPSATLVRPIDQQVAWRMRDAITAARLPFHMLCQRAVSDDQYYNVVRPVLDSAPPDAPGGVPGRPDRKRLEPVLSAIQSGLLMQRCSGPLAPAQVRWIDWVLQGASQCAQLCITQLDRHSATADTRLISGLERLSHGLQLYVSTLDSIANQTPDQLNSEVGKGFFALILQEIQHAERIWRDVIGAETA